MSIVQVPGYKAVRRLIPTVLVPARGTTCPVVLRPALHTAHGTFAHRTQPGPDQCESAQIGHYAFRLGLFLRTDGANASSGTGSTEKGVGVGLVEVGGGVPPIDHILLREQHAQSMPCIVRFAPQAGRETKAHVAYPLICRARIKPPLLACPLRRRMEENMEATCQL